METSNRRERLATLTAALIVALVTALVAGCSTTAVHQPTASQGAAGSADVATAVATSVPTPTPAPTPTPTPTPTPVPRFEPDRAEPPAQRASWSAPLVLDWTVLDGRLPNGLQYLVMGNDNPGRSAELRLVVAAGSVHEDDTAALGTAHYLEHMMFNGTERFPGNELIPILESFGAGFGPDVNAYTSFEETVYKLEVPADDPEAIQLGLDVLAEWAARATIEPEAVEAERGVMSAEHRRRTESVWGRIAALGHPILYEGTIFDGRAPVATAEDIAKTEAGDLRDYYDRWYRPDLMTVVAVGDFDPYRVNALIADRFGGLEARGDTPAPPVDDAAAGFSQDRAAVMVDPELAKTYVGIRWRVEDGQQVTNAQRHHGWVTDVALALINTRLYEAVHREGRFISAWAARRALTNHRATIDVQATVDPDDVESTVDALVEIVEAIRQHGVDQDDWDRVIDRRRAALEQRRAEVESRQDSFLADQLVEYALGNRVTVDPELDFTLETQILDSLTIEDIQRRLDEWLAVPAYLVVTSPDPETTTEERLLARFRDGVGRLVDPPDQVDPTVARSTLMERPEPAEIVDEYVIDPLGATVVTFENGVRMGYLTSTIVEASVEFKAWSRGGFFVETPDRAPLVDLSAWLVINSGFEGMDQVQVAELTGSSIVDLNGTIDRATESLTGSAAAEDSEALFQLINLQLTRPVVDDATLRSFDQHWYPLVEDPTVNPSYAANMALWRLRYGDSPYYRYLPTADELAAMDAETALAGWRSRFGNPADFVFVFVGDFDPDQLRDLGRRYLGTLPTTDEFDSVIDRDPGIPEQNLVEVVRAGIGDRGKVRINWESAFGTDVGDRVAASAVELIVSARLRDLIREQLGASYFPSVGVTVSTEPKAWVDSVIDVEGDPVRLVEISEAIHGELDRIRAGDLDPGYLTRAVDQLVRDYGYVNNPQLIDRVRRAMVYPDDDPAAYQRRAALAQALTVSDIARWTSVIFPPQRSVEVRLLPASPEAAD